MNKEIWKDVVGYEGLYRISNYGRVMSLFKKGKKKILKQFETNKGYNCLSLGRYKRSITVHRLVAIAFIPNPENKDTVNHKDGNKKNNMADNLEWMTNAENHRHAYFNGRMQKKINKELLISLIEGGKSNNNISTIFNVTPEAIQYHRRRMKTHQTLYKSI